MAKRTCIIGGGISGLTLGYLLRKRGADVVLYESSGRVGGAIRTVKQDGFLLENGPNSLLKSPRLIDLIRSLGIENEVLPANASAKKRYIISGGKLTALPMGIADMLFGGFFSFGTKMRLFSEPLRRSAGKEDESVADFFRRRFNEELVNKAADPFISGIYAGDTERLSMRHAFPRFYDLEKKYGSLLLGLMRDKSEKPDKDFPRTFSFKNGMQTLIDALENALDDSIRSNTSVKNIEPQADGRFVVSTDSGTEFCDSVVIATPANAAAKLLENIDQNCADELRKIEYPPVAQVYLGYKKNHFRSDPDGFGFLIPSGEKRKILGAVWNSVVFAGRSPDGYHLVTAFAGGSRGSDVFELSDEELIATVHAELSDLMDINDDADLVEIKRWPQAIPQYNIGYEKTVAAIEKLEQTIPNLSFCSNFYKGISVGDCVKNAYAVDEHLADS